MKTAPTLLLAAAFLLHPLATPVDAQSDASSDAKADNAPAGVAKGGSLSPDDDLAPVRIDHTGIHVGGADPVDINVPDIGWGSRVGPLIPIVSILAVFGMPVAIIGLLLYFRHRRNKMLHETLRAMVEKGVPIPPELISGPGMASTGSNEMRRGINDLRNGLILVGIGGGVFLLAGMAGFIPLFIGIAMIVAWLITNKGRKNQSPQ
ncbi:MAG TPA: DUF6249 domain-containing protein [Verrucomicrobiae bacterium]